MWVLAGFVAAAAVAAAAAAVAAAAVVVVVVVVVECFLACVLYLSFLGVCPL